MGYLDSEAFGADTGKEVDSYYWFKDCDDEECKDVEDDQGKEAGCAAGPKVGWG